MARNFSEGEYVICILNNRATLTVGKEYLIRSINGEYVTVENDVKIQYVYINKRFINKNEFRKYKINEILK